MTPSLDPRRVLRASQHVVWVEVENEVVVVDGNGSSHLLSGEAATIWGLFDGRSSVADIAADVAEVFDSPGVDVAQDVRDFADGLERRGLLEARPTESVSR